jgi:5'-deoxynucleotidase YfbR-like HD superfamily hydrolase
MKNLVNLFKLIELTRSQVQYGYLLSGIHRDKLSNLAEHHYLVTFIGWQLALNLKESGAKIDTQKVLEFCLVHDLGELMGGDISGPYAKMNKRALRFAKMFEAENQKFLSKFFGSGQKHFRKIAKEILDAKSDEALIAKVADYLECTSYKIYVGNWLKSDKKHNSDKIGKIIRKIKDKTAKKMLGDFAADWFKQLEKTDYLEILGK